MPTTWLYHQYYGGKFQSLHIAIGHLQLVEAIGAAQLVEALSIYQLLRCSQTRQPKLNPEVLIELKLKKVEESNPGSVVPIALKKTERKFWSCEATQA